MANDLIWILDKALTISPYSQPCLATESPTGSSLLALKGVPPAKNEAPSMLGFRHAMILGFLRLLSGIAVDVPATAPDHQLSAKAILPARLSSVQRPNA
jgi:hypothetical protein